jgi:hypothetical protein
VKTEKRHKEFETDVREAILRSAAGITSCLKCAQCGATLIHFVGLDGGEMNSLSGGNDCFFEAIGSLQRSSESRRRFARINLKGRLLFFLKEKREHFGEPTINPRKIARPVPNIVEPNAGIAILVNFHWGSN